MRSSELGLAAGVIKRAIAFGISQSGRFLRTYLYYGFNEDESHRKVFDGVMAHVAGAGRGSFNHRFAQPSRDGHPYINFFYPTDIFPFSDDPQRDPETGITDGLLTHAGKPQFVPKVFYTNSSYEYWGRAASLVHTTVDGQKDMPLPENVRAYLLAAGQHGVANFPPARTIGQQMNNPLDYRWVMRTLLVSMNRWVGEGIDPPPSAIPRIADGTLVAPDKLAFPRLPVGQRRDWCRTRHITPTMVPSSRPRGSSRRSRRRSAPRFRSSCRKWMRMATSSPASVCPNSPCRVATYTGWNLFNERSGPTNVVSSMQGSFIPFARSRAERDRVNDPRRSVEERYQGRDQYLALIGKAAQDLVGKGYLLSADVARIVEQAGTRWDYTTARAATQ